MKLYTVQFHTYKYAEEHITRLIGKFSCKSHVSEEDYIKYHVGVWNDKIYIKDCTHESYCKLGRGCGNEVFCLTIKHGNWADAQQQILKKLKVFLIGNSLKISTIIAPFRLTPNYCYNTLRIMSSVEVCKETNTIFSPVPSATSPSRRHVRVANFPACSSQEMACPRKPTS